jgi:ribosomal protein S18 acetylase RimI-like enzyme
MSMDDSIKLRPAQPADADIASALLCSAYIHEQVTYPLPEKYSFKFIGSLQHFFRREENRFSYQYSQIAEYKSAVVGLILSFAGRDEERLNAATGWHLEREAHDDEWYIDALAVLDGWGHRGIGTRLLQMAEQQALEHHYAKIALSVAQGNSQALSLYQHLHYRVTQETFLYQQPYLRMVKTLKY